MVDSYLSTKIGVNSLDGFSENVFYGWTDDGRPDFRHGISSADTNAELKIHPKAQIFIRVTL